MVVKIALCDDNEKETRGLKKDIEKIFADDIPDCVCSIRTYISGRDLWEHLPEVYDIHILFLDIGILGANGPRVIRELNRHSGTLKMIFVTNRDDMVYESIRYNPFRVIRKQQLKQEFPEALTDAVRQVKNQWITCLSEMDAVRTQVPLSEVVYLECSKHYLILHCADGSLKTVRGKMADFSERLEKKGFIRVHSGYLVNIKYIQMISSQKVCLGNREELPVSRNQIKHVKDAHADYFRRMIHGVVIKSYY